MSLLLGENLQNEFTSQFLWHLQQRMNPQDDVSQICVIELCFINIGLTGRASHMKHTKYKHVGVERPRCD